MTNSIIAPYSFVPLSKKVFAPDWAYSVSHDVPLKDSLSGYIELKLENHGDICVGAGSETREDGKKGKVVWARLPGDKDRLVIPGSSVKGMIRNVLEIVSLARLTPESMYQVRKFSHRILGNTSTGQTNDYTADYNKYNCCSAWLKYNLEKECWEIRKSDSDFKLVKVFDKDLNSFLGLSSKDAIHNEQPATEKYKKAKSSNKNLDLNKRVAVDCVDEPGSKFVQPYKKVTSISIAKSDEKAGGRHCTGYVVFSNHRIGNNQEQKCFSYIFPDDKLQPPVEVSADIVEKFSSVSPMISELHKYLLKHQNNDLGIPVWAFSNKNSGKVEVLGYPKMPRLPCKYDTKDVIATHQGGFSKERELADEIYFSLPEVMFGTVRKKYGEVSFKSRVSFSDMVSGKVSSGDFKDMSVVLNSPKPSFTAMYLEDNKTYSAKDGIPCASGFKRYRPQTCSTTGTEGSDGVTSTMEVLKNKKTFEGKVMFHNLKKEELGALLWCLRFGENFKDDQNGHDSPYYHNLGHGKPYGLGAVQFSKISVKVADYDSFGFRSKSLEELNAFVADFEKLMDTEFTNIGCMEGTWSDSAQVAFLKSLAVLQNEYENSNQVYNDLNDFAGLRYVPMPQVLSPETGAALSRSEPKDKAVPGMNGLETKYSGNAGFEDIFKRSAEDTGKKDIYQSYLTNLKQKEKDKEAEELIAGISCETLKSFCSSPAYVKLQKNPKCVPGELPVQEITNFLNDMVNVDSVNPADKEVLVNILSQEWLKTFTGVKAKMKERKALVRQVKEKHGIQ
ncbi:MAG: TIGR03986 family CRISPR-associated RAMP protein [Succinimonas sp.]|nr:TIGR03986 family CRISPR-associated RAMP protein [Succinimonas sp.]